MISKIELQNVQNHRHSVLDLSPGVNVIIGRSRNGKSAILRGLRKLVENRPVQGLEAWIRGHDPKGRISIRVDTTDGHMVSWDGPSDQRYVVDGEELKAFGASVPEPVSEALNLGDINFAHQFDQPFLIFDSPGQVARYLNQVVNLEVIDRTLANAQADVRTNRQAIEGERKRIKELEEAKAGFPDLDAAEEFIIDLEAKEVRLGKAAQLLTLAEHVRDNLASFRAELAKARLPEGVEVRVRKLGDKQDLLEQKRYTRGYCFNVKGQLIDLRRQKEALRPLFAVETLVEGLADLAGLLVARRRELALANRVMGQLRSERERLGLQEAQVAGLERQFHEEWPGRCPLCGK